MGVMMHRGGTIHVHLLYSFRLLEFHHLQVNHRQHFSLPVPSNILWCASSTSTSSLYTPFVSLLSSNLAGQLFLRFVPHRYASKGYTLDMLLAFRKWLNGGDEGLKVSVNDLMLEAIGVAMRRVPEMNSKWVEGVGLVDNGSVDVSMAVAIEGGLITPIVTDVDRKGLREVAEMTKDLVERARQGNLEPEEFEGGGFSLSNLGMFGIPRFSAIINPPQSGILAVGSGVATAVMGEDGKLSSATEGIATLSTDGRAIEEETAAEFLQEFSKCMSNPEYILL